LPAKRVKETRCRLKEADEPAFTVLIRCVVFIILQAYGALKN
jgi:hypothetical protein